MFTDTRGLLIDVAYVRIQRSERASPSIRNLPHVSKSRSACYDQAMAYYLETALLLEEKAAQERRTTMRH